MEPLVFLSAVLPSVGNYCVAVIDPPTKVQYFVDNQDAMRVTSELQDTVGRNTYMALASFDDAKSRKAEHALYMRSFFLDLDCGIDPKTNKQKMYLTKRDAVVALDAFLQASGLAKLGRPWLVDSGGGVHVYWPLDRDVPVAGWKVVAEMLKQTAYALQFKIDQTVTADAARVLRMPGTHNRKYGPDRMVTLRNTGDIFSLSEFTECLTPVTTSTSLTSLPGRPPTLRLPGKPPTGAKMSATALALAANSDTSFRRILTRTAAGDGCAQIDFYTKNAQQAGMEPLWRALLSIAKPCTDGVKAATVLSKMHPYDLNRMHTKLAEIKGPYPCVKIDSENPGVCGGCQHWGKITNPLALGRETQVVVEESEIEIEEDGRAQTIVRPKPPLGFTYGRNGGVFYTKAELNADGDTQTSEHMLLPFDFFMLDTLVEDGVYTTRFLAIKNGSKTIVAVPNKVVTNKDAATAALAAQNIMASFGAGNDKHLFNYVRGCIGEASTEDNALIVPPNYGWQFDGGFAVGDTVYKQDGSSYTFVSNKLANLIEVTRPHGELQDWARVMHMLMVKQLWGQIANLALSFGSALKQFTPAGAKAFTFHIASSSSGVGKTLALSLSNSVWGHPVNFSVKPATSERTMLQRAGMLGSLPLNIDEVTNKVRGGDKEWLPNHIFDFSQGGHKLKGMGSANAEMRDDLHWSSNSTLTSNAPMMEAMMGARETTSNGEMYRLLEWRTHDKLLWEPHERETLKLLESNYGTAGRVWAQWLVKNQALAQKAVADAMQQWRDLMFSPDEERFWTAGAASAIAAAVLLGPQYANIITIPVAPLVDFFKKRVQEARRIINTNKVFALDLLHIYIREHHGGFIKVSDPGQKFAVFADGRSVSKDSAKGAVKGRVEYNVVPGYTDFYVDIRLLKEFCARRNKSYIEFVQELQQRVSIVEMRKDLLAKTNGPPYRVLCLKVSQANEELEP